MSIFISYRRGASSAIAGRIDDRLRAHFGRQRVFRDVDSVPLGSDFRRVISDAVQRCDVFLAVVGGDYFGERIKDPKDFVRIEVEAALAQNKPIIPVLVGGAALPVPESLPDTVAPIVWRNGASLDLDRRFEDDMKFLIGGIEHVEEDAKRVGAASASAHRRTAIASGRREAAGRLASHDFDGAIAILDRLSAEYPDSLEVRRLRESVAVEAACHRRVASPQEVTAGPILTRVPTAEAAPSRGAVMRAWIRGTRNSRRIALLATVTVVAIVSLFGPMRSYLSSSAYAKSVRTIVDRLASGRVDSVGLVRAETLESLEELAKSLEKADNSSSLFPRHALTNQLHTAVERLVVRPILRADLMKAASAGSLSGSELMDALVLHLLLTQDKQPDEPTPRTDRWQAGARLAAEKAGARWGSLTNQPAAGRAPSVLENLVRFYALGIVDPADMIDRDKKFITYARVVLTYSGDDPLAALINDPAMPRDLRSVDLLGSAGVLLGPEQAKNKREVAVRGAFTPAGYTAIMKRLAQLEKARDDDENSWVLGKERKAHDARAIAKIQVDYFALYIATWKRFLLSLSMHEPASLDEARALIRQLIAEHPLETAWKNIRENLVSKHELPSGQAGAPAETRGWDARDAGPEQIEAAFAGLLRFGSGSPTGIERYRDILTGLWVAIGDHGPQDRKVLQRSADSARIKLASVVARYDDRGWEGALLERLLMPAISGVSKATSHMR